MLVTRDSDGLVAPAINRLDLWDKGVVSAQAKARIRALAEEVSTWTT